jgi:transposase-like protein
MRADLSGMFDQSRRPRKFAEAFRQSAVERMKTCKDVSALARELQVSRSQVYRWRDEALGRIAVDKAPAW